MTFEKCQSVLGTLRRRQGTRTPLVRVDYGGTVFTGRVARSDSDATARRPDASPYGVLVLETPGLVRGPETILQIANIPDGGIHPIEG